MNRTHKNISCYKSHKLLFSAHEWLCMEFDYNSFFNDWSFNLNLRVKKTAYCGVSIVLDVCVTVHHI